jgi:hypothetical protein
MRRRLDALLEAPGFTRGRFIALAIVSSLATAVVVAAGMRDDGTPYGVLAAAYSRPAAHVNVTEPPSPSPAPIADAAASDASTSDAPRADPRPAVSGPVASAPEEPTASAPVIAPNPAPRRTTPTPPTPTRVPLKKASKIKHVFVVYIATGGVYLDQLRPQGAQLAGYKPLSGGDLATLVALTSGQKSNPDIDGGCTTYSTACTFPIQTLSLPDQLVSKGLRWRAYEEDLSNGPNADKSCRHPAQGAADDTAQGRAGDEYATRHNPFVYYDSLTQLGECTSSDLPLTALPDDLKTEQATPNFSFIAPNLCNGGWEDPCADGSAGGPDKADAFLSTWLPQILDSPAYKADGLLVVLTNSGALMVSQFLPKGAVDQSDADAFGVLRYLEDLFGLDYLGGANEAAPLMLAVPH